jgi:hypothetical protein
MPRTALKVLIVAGGLTLAFAAGAVTAILSRWGTPIATIHVRNETAREISAITVTYRTCDATHTLLFDRAAQRASRAVPRDVRMDIVLCGEGGHTTEVAFADGHTLRSEGSYIEGGYVVTERILESGITSEYTRTLP